MHKLRGMWMQHNHRVRPQKLLLFPGALMRIFELQAVRDCAAARVALQQ